MKSHVSLSLVALVLTLGFCLTGNTFAQATAGQTGAGQHGGMLSSLSPGDKAKLLKARQEVLAANPDLKAEQEDLMKQREAMKNDPDATPEERTAFFQSFVAHDQKMKAAMLKVDPTLAPVFAQLDQEMKQKMAQRAAAAGGGGN